jgi:glycerophosphoryl diester phosphodiesterase
LSPALLLLAQRHAPEIERILIVSGLQLLTKKQIEEALHMPVTLVDKRLDLGLQWAELGDVFRLPGYRSFEELLRTAVLAGVRVVEADLLLLHSAGRAVVDMLHATGLEVFGFTARTERDWDFLESLGVEGIYTDDVLMGVRRQAPIP